MSSLHRRAKATPRVTVKNGRTYWEPSASLRHMGFKGRALGPLNTASLNAADELNTRADQAEKPGAGTLHQILQRYQKSDLFKNLGIRGQRLRAKHLRDATEILGKRTLADTLTVADLEELRAKVSDDGFISVRTALSWAETEDLIFANPAKSITIARRGKRSRIAMRDELKAIINSLDDLGEPVAADIALTCCTGMQRVGDVRRLTCHALQDGGMTITQSKTGVTVRFAAHPAIQDRIARRRSNSPLLFANPRTGNAYTSRQLQRIWDEARTNAADDVPSITGQDTTVTDPHFQTPLRMSDLRRTGMVWASEAGATLQQIVAASGHSLQAGFDVLQHYLPRHRSLADQAVGAIAL